MVTLYALILKFTKFKTSQNIQVKYQNKNGKVTCINFVSKPIMTKQLTHIISKLNGGKFAK